jgi:trehalose-phosphatase
MDRPEAVTLSERASAVLNRLATRSRTSLAIVSGRSFVDLASRAPIPNAVLIGTHGLEVRVPGRQLITAYSDADVDVTRSVLLLLEKRLRGIMGTQLEDKGPVLAVHYRRVSSREVPHVLEIVRAVAADLGPMIRVIEGSGVFEFCPGRPFGKGSALLTAWAEFGVPGSATCLYFGNDVTDEDVFAVLPPDAITVHVGDQTDRSGARYVVDTPARVLDALEDLDQMIANRDDGDVAEDVLGSLGRTPLI